jgi:hypothetical protein
MTTRFAALALALALPAAAAPAPKTAEPSAAELAGKLSKAVEKWAADKGDNAELAPELKDKYRVLHRDAPDGSKIYGVLAPGDVVPGRLIQYGDAQAGGKKLALQRAWLHGRFLVLEFDSQKQYRDLRKADGAGGLELTGYVADGSARGFKDAAAFEHALKTFVKTPVPASLKAAADGAAGGKPYTLEAAKGKDGRVAIAAVLADGSAFAIVPTPKAPARKKAK